MRILFLSGIVLAACGSPGSFNGSVGGETLTVGYATLTSTSPKLIIALYGRATDPCPLVPMRLEPGPPEVDLVIDPPSSALSPGSFDVANVPFVSVWPDMPGSAWGAFEASNLSLISMTSGNITLDEVVTGQRVRGAFDVRFNGSDSATGTFDATVCP
jgi:hypothetical protein